MCSQRAGISMLAECLCFQKVKVAGGCQNGESTGGGGPPAVRRLRAGVIMEFSVCITFQ